MKRYYVAGRPHVLDDAPVRVYGADCEVLPKSIRAIGADSNARMFDLLTHKDVPFARIPIDDLDLRGVSETEKGALALYVNAARRRVGVAKRDLSEAESGLAQALAALDAADHG